MWGDAGASADEGVLIPSVCPHPLTTPTAADRHVLSAGIERFGYFEQLAAISRGEAEFASLLPEQHRYDVYFEDLPH